VIIDLVQATLEKEYVMTKPEITISELKRIFVENGLDFYIKKQKDCIVKVHFMVKTDEAEN